MSEEKHHRIKVSLEENQFIVPSYSIYGGLSGFHDYGLLGTKVKRRFLDIWRSFFLDDDGIDEIETPIIIPFEALDASGHIDRFTDYIVKDGSGRIFRADHLVKGFFNDQGMNDIANKVDGWSKDKLQMEINKNKIIEPWTDPKTKKKVIPKVETKNLMYGVAASSPNSSTGIDFLRPELAQGIFLNYPVCQAFLKKDLPFGLAQIGKSYRKEISPQPLIRMREFTQAEIEYFVDPNDKSHYGFNKVVDYSIPLLTSSMQLGDEKLKLVTVGEAVNSGLISHQTIGYYLARIHIFALKIGLREEKIRFRQHLPHEMAHYASECWDLETFVNGDWLECIGCADRGSYDLMAHSSRANMKARRKLEKPIVTYRTRITVNKRPVAQRYKEATGSIVKYFENLEESKYETVKQNLEKNGSIYIYIDELMYVITKDMLKIEEVSDKKDWEDYIPNVIEPSFGIDRLLYSVLEQNFWTRENDEKRLVLSIPRCLSPYDISVFQLHNKPEMIEIVDKITKILQEEGYKCFRDNTRTSIGKRYVRADEIGIKLAITVDPGSLKDNQVTIRDRDTLEQIRVDIDKLVDILADL